MSEGVTLSGGPHAHLLQKDVEIKSKFYGAKSDCKKKYSLQSLYHTIVYAYCFWITTCVYFHKIVCYPL